MKQDTAQNERYANVFLAIAIAVLVIFLACLTINTAHAQQTPFEVQQSTPNVTLRNATSADASRLSAPPADAAVAVRTGDVVRMAITNSGDVRFEEAATVDFANEVPVAGRFKGWVVIRVAGELRVMPSFEFVGVPPTPTSTADNK